MCQQTYSVEMRIAIGGKNCSECGTFLPFNEFHRSKCSSDGRINICKTCRIPIQQDYKTIRNGEKWRANNKIKAKLKPFQIIAENIVADAIKDGFMKKPDNCSVCGVKGDTFHIVSHHDDYKYPLNVRYICKSCHRKWHEKHGEAPHARTLDD